MTASNSFICGIVLLVFLNMAAILAFASPYWIVESVYTGTSQNRHGLFFECGSHKLCQANDNLQFGLADGTEAVTGLILLVITDLGTIISFATPFWIMCSSGADRGLWATCQKTSCEWIFEARENCGMDFSEQGWFIAVQGLMSVGLALCLLSLLIATISLCCQKQNCSPSGVIAGLLLTAFLAMCIAVILFGIKTSQDHNVKATIGSSDGNSFGWSFWLAAGAAALSLATSGVYGCASRID